MKTLMNRADLDYGLGVIMGAINKKKPEAYVGSILMVSHPGSHRVDLHATDMEIFAMVSLDGGSNERQGKIVLPAEKFAAAIKNCGSGDVLISSGNDLKTSIEGKSAEYEIAGLDPADYPTGPSDSQDLIFAFPAGKLAAYIMAVGHAVCHDSTKETICGINFALSETGRLTVAATDGHRLSIAGMDLPGENIQDKFTAHTFTLPQKAASILSRITATIAAGRVFKQSRLYFQSGSISICTAEGTKQYPDVRRIIPSGAGEVITVDTAALIEALESTCIMSDDEYRSVNLSICGEKISVSALGTNNTARASVPCLSDCDIKIRINSRYLIQALKSIDSTEVFLKWFDARSPLMLIPADHKSWDERIEIIMMLGGE